ncbi:MAG: rhodanese-like domain-containing protein [Acidobacteria bacterium]|nr:rhodanese-like domain-containing protein [Acidobacteriota bacterium]
MKTIRFFLAIVFASSLVAGLTACAETNPALDNIEAIIDVRTPEEFAEGHLQGAINIDVQSADFEKRIGELDETAHYYIYCRSGRRSEIAHEKMIALGFTKVADLGSLEDATTVTSLPIVR